MTRQMKGILGFGVLGIVLGIVVWPFMVGREIWQYKTGRAKKVEWEDLLGYSIVIGMASVAHWCVCDLAGLPWWSML